MANIPLGATGEVKLLVTSKLAIDFMGTEDARVLSTPHLIWNLEMACYHAIKPYLEPGFDSVGTDVQVRHLAATPLGMSVIFRAEVIRVEDRKIRFRVEASDEVEKVAEGEHERFIVQISRFAARVQAKSAR